MTEYKPEHEAYKEILEEIAEDTFVKGVYIPVAVLTPAVVYLLLGRFFPLNFFSIFLHLLAGAAAVATVFYLRNLRMRSRQEKRRVERLEESEREHGRKIQEARFGTNIRSSWKLRK